MNEKSMWNRIPAEAATHAKPWALPLVGQHSQVLPSFEKEQRERAQAKLRAESESITTVEMPVPVVDNRPTAEELQQIFDSAERDGFNKGQAQGFQQGQEAGFEAGRQQAYAEYKAALVEEQIRFRKLADALADPAAHAGDALEAMMVKAIALMTQSVIKRELKIDSAHIVRLVQEAVEALPVGYEQLKLTVNPVDVDALENYKADNGLDWQILADASMSPAGLKIETAQSRIDERVEVRLKQVLQQFATKQLSSLPPEVVPEVQESAGETLFVAEENPSPLASLGLDELDLSDADTGVMDAQGDRHE